MDGSSVSSAAGAASTIVLGVGDGQTARNYIAEMAAELSSVALAVGEARLAETLSRAAALARGTVEA